ncbi:hypothetical protein HYH03_016074 [Edaphochlamys debaryana]|uniref:Guanylate cyclase domain-containing protein n=1 Tax=Edaphochlamys debaryana TaxID=47281 RepID=A0A836BQI6_9CHLO|nr:hypothetical protein HYH03_016074 [Edaphochlamys debaryana]|eukprot:KAG2485185.1 hypothetical protein HYH03_016074 [Edaphochlamys debaryana]
MARRGSPGLRPNQPFLATLAREHTRRALLAPRDQRVASVDLQTDGELSLAATAALAAAASGAALAYSAADRCGGLAAADTAAACGASGAAPAADGGLLTSVGWGAQALGLAEYAALPMLRAHASSPNSSWLRQLESDAAAGSGLPPQLLAPRPGQPGGAAPAPLLLLYRRDWLERLAAGGGVSGRRRSTAEILEVSDLLPPTWDMLARLLGSLVNEDLDGDSRPDHALCVDLLPDGPALPEALRLYAALAASNAAPFTPGGQALSRSTVPVTPEELLAAGGALDPTSGAPLCGAINPLFAAGRCLFTIDWAPSALRLAYQNVSGVLGAALLPGSLFVSSTSADGSTIVEGPRGVARAAPPPPPPQPQQLLPCIPTRCPHAEPLADTAALADAWGRYRVDLRGTGVGQAQQEAGEELWVNRAPLLGEAGDVWVLAPGQSPATAMRTAEFIRLAAFELGQQYSLLVDGNRRALTDTAVALELPPADVSAVTQALAASAAHPNAAMDVLLPYSSSYRAALDELASGSLLATAAGNRSTDVPRLLEATRVKFVTALQAFPYPAIMKAMYWESIGLSNELDTIGIEDRSTDKFNVVGVAVGVSVGGTVLLVLAGLFLLWRLRLRPRAPLLSRGVKPPGPGPATTLALTDVQNSTLLWEVLSAELMDECMAIHHGVMRMGDAFAVAFHDPEDALTFAMDLQAALLVADWPPELLAHTDGCEVWARRCTHLPMPLPPPGPLGRSLRAAQLADSALDASQRPTGGSGSRPTATTSSRRFLQQLLGSTNSHTQSALLTSGGGGAGAGSTTGGLGFARTSGEPHPDPLDLLSLTSDRQPINSSPQLSIPEATPAAAGSGLWRLPASRPPSQAQVPVLIHLPQLLPINTGPHALRWQKANSRTWSVMLPTSGTSSNGEFLTAVGSTGPGAASNNSGWLGGPLLLANLPGGPGGAQLSPSSPARPSMLLPLPEESARLDSEPWAGPALLPRSPSPAASPVVPIDVLLDVRRSAPPSGTAGRTALTPAALQLAAASEGGGKRAEAAGDGVAWLPSPPLAVGTPRTTGSDEAAGASRSAPATVILGLAAAGSPPSPPGALWNAGLAAAWAAVTGSAPGAARLPPPGPAPAPVPAVAAPAVLTEGLVPGQGHVEGPSARSEPPSVAGAAAGAGAGPDLQQWVAAGEGSAHAPVRRLRPLSLRHDSSWSGGSVTADAALVGTAPASLRSSDSQHGGTEPAPSVVLEPRTTPGHGSRHSDVRLTPTLAPRSQHRSEQPDPHFHSGPIVASGQREVAAGTGEVEPQGKPPLQPAAAGSTMAPARSHGRTSSPQASTPEIKSPFATAGAPSSEEGGPADSKKALAPAGDGEAYPNGNPKEQGGAGVGPPVHVDGTLFGPMGHLIDDGMGPLFEWRAHVSWFDDEVVSAIYRERERASRGSLQGHEEAGPKHADKPAANAAREEAGRALESGGRAEQPQGRPPRGQPRLRRQGAYGPWKRSLDGREGLPSYARTSRAHSSGPGPSQTQTPRAQPSRAGLQGAISWGKRNLQSLVSGSLAGSGSLMDTLVADAEPHRGSPPPAPASSAPAGRPRQGMAVEGAQSAPLPGSMAASEPAAQQEHEQVLGRLTFTERLAGKSGRLGLLLGQLVPWLTPSRAPLAASPSMAEPLPADVVVCTSATPQDTPLSPECLPVEAAPPTLPEAAAEAGDVAGDADAAGDGDGDREDVTMPAAVMLLSHHWGSPSHASPDPATLTLTTWNRLSRPPSAAGAEVPTWPTCGPQPHPQPQPMAPPHLRPPSPPAAPSAERTSPSVPSATAMAPTGSGLQAATPAGAHGAGRLPSGASATFGAKRTTKAPSRNALAGISQRFSRSVLSLPHASAEPLLPLTGAPSVDGAADLFRDLNTAALLLALEQQPLQPAGLPHGAARDPPPFMAHRAASMPQLGGGCGYGWLGAAGATVAAAFKLLYERLTVEEVAETRSKEAAMGTEMGTARLAGPGIGDPELVLRGLRIRVGLHSGPREGEVELAVVDRVEVARYKGDFLATAKEVGDAAVGGIIVISGATFRAFQQLGRQRSRGRSDLMLLHLGEYVVKPPPEEDLLTPRAHVAPVQVQVQDTTKSPARAHELFLAMCPGLLPRLALLPSPVRTHRETVPGFLSAPAGEVAPVFCNVLGVEVLLSWEKVLQERSRMLRTQSNVALGEHGPAPSSSILGSRPTGDINPGAGDTEYGAATRSAQVSSMVSRGGAVHAALGILRDSVVEAATRHGGYVVASSSDGGHWVLVFPAPEAAVQWGLEMLQAMLTADWPAGFLEHELTEEQWSDGVVVRRGLRLHIGIDYGRAMVRLVPRTGRLDYVGRPMNRAARIAAKAKAATVLVSDTVWNSVRPSMGPAVRGRSLGQVQLKGVREPLELWVLQGAA